ncbi:hypothetical protein FOH10_11850 [Nocardia otitidiscaviarum]|uniref:Uncharacterized protein n=2 Tax=Nocardia otitidiscaviarum TaxID=1823 RepID=A0A516NK75_9NOCA|nr:hypothetical protein [Nocardia otitidiscaviarum]MCP9619286.1 hypothetical protein [Nocardia otitidiscaviarum]QDP79308.1 hypothetical protein FOH10_11850 [Nocardia otitidiscaviarum]
MGKRQQVDRLSPRRRLSSLAVVGALPFSVALAGTASAEPIHPEDMSVPPATATEEIPQTDMVLHSPLGPLTVPIPPELADGVRGWLDTTAAATASTSTPAAGTEATEAMSDGTQPVADAPTTRVSRNSPVGVRDIPGGSLAAVDPEQLRMPDPASAPAVAPIAAPEGKLRFGDTQVDVPGWLSPEQADQVNTLSATAEAELARTLDSAGFEPSRSDRIAAQTIGTAAVGAAVGVGVAAPAEAAALVMGGFIGAMVGTPFAPAGWVVGPAVGATAGVTLVAVPAAAAGAAVGAAVGAANGYLAPATEVPAAAPTESATAQ